MGPMSLGYKYTLVTSLLSSSGKQESYHWGALHHESASRSSLTSNSGIFPFYYLLNNVYFPRGYQNKLQESCRCVSEVILAINFHQPHAVLHLLTHLLRFNFILNSISSKPHESNPTPRSFIKISQLILTNFIQLDNSKHWFLCHSCQSIHELTLHPSDPSLFTPFPKYF